MITTLSWSPPSVSVFPSVVTLGKILTGWYDGGRPLLLGGLPVMVVVVVVVVAVLMEVVVEVAVEILLGDAVFSLSSVRLIPRPRPRGEKTP